MNSKVIEKDEIDDRFTDAQKNVIKHSAGNLLVSASAGSGKTSVLIEKIIRLIKSGSVNLKNLLVVTFTNSASLEIKQRLYSSLTKSNNEKLLSQIDDLSVSDILTFDSFCIKIVKEFGYTIGRHNNFSVADESLSGFLKNQALDNVFSLHSKNLDDRFVNFVNSFFGNRDDQTLKTSISRLHDFLRSKNNDDFSYKDLLKEIYALDDNNRVLKYFNNYVLFLKQNFLNSLNELEIESSSTKDEKLIAGIDDAKNQLSMLGDNCLKNFEIFRLNEINIPTIRRYPKKDDPAVSELKCRYAEAKNLFLTPINKIITKQNKFLSKNQIENDLQSTKNSLEYIFDIVKEFDDEYAKLKQKYQVLDFNDVERLANKILNDTNIATSIQNKYDWIFVDEYQDTSLLQESIIKKITSGDNLFMVGDFKQSIYRFRQAEPKIFINKYRQYKNMQTGSSVIELNTNFRSEDAILKFDNFVFDKIFKKDLDEFEYSEGQDLEFGGYAKKSTSDAQVEIIVVPKSEADDDEDDTVNDIENQTENDLLGLTSENVNDETNDFKHDNNSTQNVYSVKDAELSKGEHNDVEKEALVLAQNIRHMLDKTYFDAKQQVDKKIQYADIAVLSRHKKSVMLEIRKILKDCNIPVNVQYSEKLFDSYDMQILLNILKTIDNLRNDISLVSSLSNIGGLSFDELAKIRLEYKNEKFFYIAVENYVNNHNDTISQKLSKFYEKIEQYKVDCMHKNIAELILHIISKENLDEYFSINDYGEQFESHKKLMLSSIKSIKDYSLSEFVKYIDTFGRDIEYDVNIKDSENAVTLTTIHGSKGLEYPVVFLVMTGKTFGRQVDHEKILMDNDWGISMSSFDKESHSSYENIIKKIFKLKIKEENKKEEKRLLYVALTRPKNYLTIIGSAKLNDLHELNSDIKIYNANSYLKWIVGAFNETEISALIKNKVFKKNIDAKNKVVLKIADDKFDFEKDDISVSKPETISIDKKRFIDILSQKFPHSNLSKKNSVTQIMQSEEHYNISDFNYAKNDGQDDEDFLAIGTAYHKYMELLNFSNDVAEIAGQINELESSGEITKAQVSLVDKDRIIKAVLNVSQVINKRDTVLKEQPFLTYMPANELVNTDENKKILVQGVADLIVVKEDQIYLIDYKTSRLSNNEKFKQKYETQLGIYARSIESFYGKKVTKKMIYSFHLNKLIII